MLLKTEWVYPLRKLHQLNAIIFIVNRGNQSNLCILEFKLATVKEKTENCLFHLLIINNAIEELRQIQHLRQSIKSLDNTTDLINDNFVGFVQIVGKSHNLKIIPFLF
jgi:uncharacterized membrane protein